jgi:putative peptide zinc metalloprotease protein
MAFFIRELLTGKYPLLSTVGSIGLGLILLLMIYYVTTFFHECGHALTCKHYGRKVTKGGLLLYMGSPTFFVDTTDIWMGLKQARILVSLAGPLVTLVLGSLMAVLAGLFPTFSFNEVLFKAALIGYVSALINLNPLLELDGYYILTDWLEIPMLRKKSFAFIRKELPSRLFEEWSNLSREKKIYSVFGIAAAVFTGFTIVYVGYLWQREIRVMEQDFLSGQNILDVIIVGGLMLVAGANLILGLTIKALLFAGERSTQMCKYIQTLRNKSP